MIKLNGKPYLTQDEILSIIERHIISIEMASYYEVSPAIGDIPTNVADDVAKKLAEFQDTFSLHFDKEIYLKAELAVEYAKRKMYDPKKVSVGKHRTGSFGIQLRARDDEIVRYVYNICMEVFAKEFRNAGKG
jgi:hypothetical protein